VALLDNPKLIKALHNLESAKKHIMESGRPNKRRDFALRAIDNDAHGVPLHLCAPKVYHHFDRRVG
jgi:hypothetical protein